MRKSLILLSRETLKATIDNANEYRQTALTLALANGHSGVARRLINAGDEHKAIQSMGQKQEADGSCKTNIGLSQTPSLNCAKARVVLGPWPSRKYLQRPKDKGAN